MAVEEFGAVEQGPDEFQQRLARPALAGLRVLHDLSDGV